MAVRSTLWVAIAFAVASAACRRPSVAPSLRAGGAAPFGRGEPGPVWFGVDVTDADNLAGPGDSVVRITHSGRLRRGMSGYEASAGCSGTLIAPELVLTAHHCVLALDDAGELTKVDVPPQKVTVGFGGAYLPWGRASVRAVVAPRCGYGVGHGDIALLVLASPVRGVPSRVLRLQAEPEEGEQVHAIGFGDCLDARVGRTRHEREGGPVTSVGGGHFMALAAACKGDSGGPVVSPSRLDVVGVVSGKDLGGGARYESHFTRLDVWRHLFAKARAVAHNRSARGNFSTDAGCPRDNG